MPDEKTTAEALESAAIRRRWVTLAEILAVVGVVISGLALWNSYQERTAEQADKAAAHQEARARAQTVILRGTADRDGERLSLAPADPGQTIQSQTIYFPMALAVGPIETVADPRIEARWFRRSILRATADDDEDVASGDSDRRVPVAITSQFYSGGTISSDTAVYYIVYRLEGGGLFEGRELRLRGVSRLELDGVGNPAGAKNRVNRMWSARPRRSPAAS